MEIRAEINDLSIRLQASEASYSGGEALNFNGVDTTITELSKIIFEKLIAYQHEEVSLKAKTDTVDKLKETLNKYKTICETFVSCPDSLNKLLQTIADQQTILDQEKENFKFKISSKVEEDVAQYLNKTSASLQTQIKVNAFQTIKNVDNDLQRFLASKIGAPVHTSSFLSISSGLESFIASYKDVLTDRQIEKIKETIGLLKTATERSNKIEQIWLIYHQNGYLSPDAIELQIADLAYEIEQDIEKLKIGESLLIPGGYVNSDNPSHAVVYQIQRVRDQEYQFSIFNTGAGVTYGQIEDPIKIGASRVPLFTNLPQAAVSDQKFLMNLIRFNTKESKFNNMSFVHQEIESHLVGKFKGKQTVREPHDLQTWGTCTFDSVYAFLEYHLEPSLFIPVKFDMIVKAKTTLNDLFPIAYKQNLYHLAVLNFIHIKSCDTLFEWKNKFQHHCNDLQGDWFAANKIMKDHGVQTESELKILIEKLSDQAFSLNQEAFVKDILFDSGLQLMISGPIMIPLLLTTPPPISIPLFFLTCLAEGAGIALVKNNYDPELQKKREEALALMNILQNALEKSSPEQAEIIKNRLQRISPTKTASNVIQNIITELFSNPENTPTLSSLNLSGLLRLLQDRYAERSMCVPELLDSSSSRLKEAMQSCNTLIDLTS